MAYGNIMAMIWQYICHMAMNYVNYDFLLYFELPYKLPYGNKNPWLLRNVAILFQDSQNFILSI